MGITFLNTMSHHLNLITNDYVNVSITTSEQESHFIEKRFNKGITISVLKGKLELITGGNSSTMNLKVYNNDQLVCSLDDNNAFLGACHIEDGMRLHVEDQFILNSEFKRLEDGPKSGKYEISVEEYNKRTDTLKAYLIRNKLGMYNEEAVKRKETEWKIEEEKNELKANMINIGDRCLVTVPNQPLRKAYVKFVGKIQSHPGCWAGVKFDKPLGKNDGSCDGVRYFECQPNYGGFVRPIWIEVGDFSEDEEDFEDSYLKEEL